MVSFEQLIEWGEWLSDVRTDLGSVASNLQSLHQSIAQCADTPDDESEPRTRPCIFCDAPVPIEDCSLLCDQDRRRWIRLAALADILPAGMGERQQ